MTAACTTMRPTIHYRRICSHLRRTNGNRCGRVCRQHSHRAKWSSCFRPSPKLPNVCASVSPSRYETTEKWLKFVISYLDSPPMWLARAPSASSVIAWKIQTPNFTKCLAWHSIVRATIRSYKIFWLCANHWDTSCASNPFAMMWQHSSGEFWLKPSIIARVIMWSGTISWTSWSNRRIVRSMK